MENTLPPTFCPLAWSHSFVNQNGAYQLCCTSEEYDNNIRNENGEVQFVSDGVDHRDVMNAEFMKKIRLQMLNGVWPKICGRCKIAENMKGVSRRQVEIIGFEKENQELISSTAPDGSIPVKIKSADYRLGNLCNLQCRMCNPRSTKLWIKDWNALKPEIEQFSEEVMDSYYKYDWIDSPALAEDFATKAAHLEHIHFAGGEPLLVPQMAQILQRCIDSGNAGNITVTYNTNLTMLPAKVLELWKHFKAVKILASIDAVGPLNHYIRFPAKWEQIDKNLRFLEERHSEFNVTEVMLSTTVQALNVLHLPKIYEYLEQFTFIVKAPNLVNLHMPYYMQTNVLPPALRQLAKLQLQDLNEKVRGRLEPHYHYLVDNIEQIISFMSSVQTPEDRFERFLKFQNDFDSLKKLSLVDYAPEFASFTRRT
jgi:MoaA/NifB/PqqE/SkfB family radical SAM enzyme